MSSEQLPDREHLIELGGSVASSAAVLAMGFAIGVLWVGTSVQATACATQGPLTGVCELLPVIERATKYALFVVVVGFVVAFGAEYRQQEVDE